MKQSLLLCITGSLLSQVALATPTIYPKSLTFLSQIENPTTSNLVADDEDLKVIWVMPPNTASSKVEKLHTVTANMGYCQEMANLNLYSKEMSAEMHKLKLKELASQEQVNQLAEKLSDARQELSRFVTQNNLLDIQNIDDRLLLLDAEINSLNAKLETCTDHCDEFLAQLKEHRSERQALARDRRSLSQTRVKVVREMEKRKASVAAYEKDQEEAEQRWTKVRNGLDDLRTRFNAMFAEFAKLEGGRTSIAFESGWDQNVSDLARLNPGYDFKRILTKDAVIMTNLVNGGDLPPGSPILGYEVGGNYSNGKITFPSYPQSLSGNIRLSLVGACPIEHPELFNLKQPRGAEQMKYGMTIAYEFPSTFEVDVTAHYNMYKLYQKIAKSGKKGGLFSSRKWNSIEEKTFFRDEFKVQWNEQDQANSLSEEQKADYEKEIRDNIFGRLAAIGLPSVTDPGILVTPEAPPTGAAVLATSLSKNPACKVNKYCVAATIGVNVLDAIFGSSSSSSSYTNIQDVNMVEKWSNKKVIYKPWISSYR